MKYISLSFALLITANSLIAMDQTAAPVAPKSQVAASQALTSEEELNCFTWFHELSKEYPSYFDQLSQEDRDVFKQRLKLEDHPEQVRRSRTNAVRAFMEQLHQKGIKAQFSEEQVVSVLVKVTKNSSPASNTDTKQ
jgi:predicted metallo-beta-lactamase superfamily hydrolase